MLKIFNLISKNTAKTAIIIEIQRRKSMHSFNQLLLLNKNKILWVRIIEMSDYPKNIGGSLFFPNPKVPQWGKRKLQKNLHQIQ